MTEEQIEAMDILEYPQFCTFSERRKAHDFIVQELNRLEQYYIETMQKELNAEQSQGRFVDNEAGIPAFVEDEKDDK